MIKTAIRSINMTDDPDVRAILLRDSASGNLLKLCVWECEAKLVAQKIGGLNFTEPTTGEYFKQMLELSDLQIRRVAITACVDDVFYAKLIAERRKWVADELVEIDCRPSDALLLAAYFTCPIYVADAVWAKYAKSEAEVLYPFDPFHDFWQNFIDLD